MEQLHAAGQAFAEKELEVLVGHTWDTTTAVCPFSKGSQLHTELYEHERTQWAEGYETASGALCLLLDSTVHRQTGMSPEEATETVRGLEQMMHEERLRAGFVQHGGGKASGGGFPKRADGARLFCGAQR